ncbi:MAG: lytic murein transglycosylase, partial [bacterium]
MSEAAAISPSEFSQCLVEFEQKAVSGGVDRSLARKVVPELKLQKKVLDLDGKQPEFVQTFGSYLAKRVTAKRVEQGRRLYQEHRVLLDRLTREYGVPIRASSDATTRS